MRIYIASKTKHAPRWREWGALYNSKLEICSSWIHTGKYANTPSEIIDWPAHWAMCLQDVRKADALIAYHEPGETPKGSLIEIGAALMCDIPIYAVGFGAEHSWLWNNRIEICSNFRDAVDMALNEHR